MADQTHIEWTDATWNIITGCTLVDEGCRHCYAARLAATRLQHHPSRAGLARVNANGEAKFTGEVRFNEQWLDQPLRWSKPRRIFVCAHGDLFHESVPDEWIDRVFAVMALAQQHTFQVLTKRPERAIEYLAKHDTSTRSDTITDSAFLMNRAVRGYAGSGGSATWPLPNVGLGTSISDQASADLRIPPLLACQAAVRFLSAEPLLGPVSLRWLDAWSENAPATALKPGGVTNHFDGLRCLDWVIVGGESGPRARPMHPDWARTLRDQCIAAGVPFFFKQWGAWLPMGQSGFTAWSAANVRSNGMMGKKWLGFAHFNDGAGGPEKARIGPCETCGIESAKQASRIGKKVAGRRLDGREWNEMPGHRDG